MNEIEVVQQFAEAGYQISPKAASIISGCNGYAKDIINRVIKSLDDSVLVVDVNHIESIQSQLEHTKKTELSASFVDEVEVNILSDISEQSTCIGEYEEFVQYFRNRYSRLSEMIRARISARPIESIYRKNRNMEYGEISIIGMVSEIKTTAKGHKLIELEDPTGRFPVLVLKKDNKLFELSNHIVLDEVIGVTGSLTNKNDLLIANNIIWPDLPNPRRNEKNKDRSKNKGRAILISDLHVGSNTFLEDAWLRFIDWLNLKIGEEKQKALAKQVKYIVVAGDLVDGIGVYPNQEKELLIKNINKQYEKAAEYFSEIPKKIRVIIAPGNHDAVRQFEPQPKLGYEFTSMFSNNISFVGNPALIEINGVHILIYHGKSMDDLIPSVPGMSYQNPSKVMIEMLRRRHLSPIYGGSNSIAPELSDHFIIDPIPDILHCGHVHTVGIARYKGVLVINSGAWQDQTEYQKHNNINPVPARASMVDLNTMNTSILKFM
ncbi:MAG: DNA-directed DNA polymerase II small subunit [Methanosarcinales archaeon]